MSDEVLIKTENVSKKFCRSLKRSLWYGVRDVVSELTGKTGQKHELRKNEFWAVKDVSFELKRGECLGLIGRNGAGKSTLLKMLNGLIKIDEGTIMMRGRIGALIQLGAGFNPILTGRENVYINAAVLGISKERVNKIFDEIVDFSGIEDFIDTPVQSYSSGMRVRLGFAVATALEPDVLLIDEVLSVGDASFRGKCFRRIDDLRKDCAVILVSHNIEQIGRICSSTIVMDKGQCVYQGDVDQGLGSYRDLCEVKSKGFINCFDPITSCEIAKDDIKITHRKDLVLNISIKASEETFCYFRAVFYNNIEQVVAEGNMLFNGLDAVRLKQGENNLTLTFGNVSLQGGNYRVSIVIYDQIQKQLVQAHMAVALEIDASHLGETAYQLPFAINTRDENE